MHVPPPVHGAAMVGKYIKDSEIINNTFDTRYINLGTSITVDEIGKGGLKKWMRFFGILGQTFKQVLSWKPDIVYFTITANGLGFYKDAVVALIAKVLNRKVVYHYHNKGVSERQDRGFDNFLYKLIFKNAEVILLSEHLYYDIKKYVPKERVHICPNGVPEITITASQDVKQNETIQFLFLSNLLASKGVYVLLEACQVLKDKGHHFYCTFVGGVGDTTAQEFQMEVDRLGLTEYAAYVGPKYGEEKQHAFAKADIFVFPTYYHNETFGLVNLEAMQFALPVISTPEGGIPDVVLDGETGFLVAQKNADALTEKIEVLIKDPALRATMGAAGKAHYQKHFTLKAFEQTMNTILKQIA